MHTPDSNTSTDWIEQPDQSGSPHRTASEIAEAMGAVVASGDALMAAALVREAEARHPGEVALVSGIARCKAIINRAHWLDESLEAMRCDFAEDHLAAALGHFREALSLSRGLPLLKAAADSQAEAQSDKLLPHNWRVAETLVQEAAETEPFFRPDANLREKLRQARHDEMITRALHQVDRAEFDGKVDEARRKLTDLLTEYPHENRLVDRLRAVDQRPTATSALNFDQSKSDPKLALTQYDRAKALTSARHSSEPTQPWGAKVLVAQAAWNSVKNFVALAVTTGMLGIAGVLIWRHVQNSAQPPPVASTNFLRVRPPLPRAPLPATAIAAPLSAPDAIAPPDEQAWQLVKTSDDAASIRLFLTAYPASTHALRAKLKLAALQWGNLDKTNANDLTAYIQLHRRSPYKAEAERYLLELNSQAPAVDAAPASAADRDAILAAVRAYRQAGLQSPEQPNTDVLDDPVIDGESATLRCRATDSVDATAVTYSLLKRDGIWVVEGVR